MRTYITDMEKKKEITIRKIFRYLMENGYEPTLEKTYILFSTQGNTGVMEYDEGIISLRLFFSIEEDEYSDFLEASNSCMQSVFMIRPVVLDDRKTLMFSCENICDTFRDFERFFPKMVETLQEGLTMHKYLMKLNLRKSFIEQDTPEYCRNDRTTKYS